jgi:hypothetical protein
VTAVVLALWGLALADGAFSGFRASLGRAGLVDHAARDRRGLLRGTALVVVLLAPAVMAAALDVRYDDEPSATYRRAGEAFLAVVGPYALLVVLALAAYGLLRWELKYLASAVILGPFTLVRPYVLVAAVVVAVVRVPDAGLLLTALLAGGAVLAVEPLLNLVERRSPAA